MQNQTRQILQNSPLFKGLWPDLIDQIAAATTRRKLGPDQILFQKCYPADALWGVLSGRVVSVVSTDDGRELVLDSFVQGEVFGEVGVLDFFFINAVLNGFAMAIWVPLVLYMNLPLLPTSARPRAINVVMVLLASLFYLSFALYTVWTKVSSLPIFN